MKFTEIWMKYDVLVIGAGAAGLMAALAAAQEGASVLLLERNEKVGRKIYITGKGRCNLTNVCDMQDFFAQVPRGAKFLRSAIGRFTPQDTMAYFERLGVPLKVERGNRVFPVSDRASDVIDALFMALRRQGVTLQQATVRELSIRDGAVTGVKTDKGIYSAQITILATGGMSYPATGSTGDGYAFAQAAGHQLAPCRASLVPLVSPDVCCKQMQGLSLKNVRLGIHCGKQRVFSEQGELLFTHFGISGPLVLSASTLIEDFSDCVAHINLKPALSEQQLHDRILRELTERQNQDMKHVLGALLPRLMIEPMLKKAEIDPSVKGNSLTRAQRNRLVELLQRFPLTITGTRPIEEAVVTRGGVELHEVEPKTMKSKQCKGLYLAGEVLDIDARTGGFNLQLAWSTGRLAGISAAKESREHVV